MNRTPFRSCDYCGAEEEPRSYSRALARKPWTLQEHSRKLSCPKCMTLARQEDDRARKVLQENRELLKYRVMAEPEGEQDSSCKTQGASLEGECLGCDGEDGVARHKGEDLSGKHLVKYRTIKDQYQDAVLVFRAGDWYYILEEDAKLCAHELGLTSGLQWVDDELVTLASFPHTAREEYLPRLVRNGHRVAVCDKIEGPPVPDTVQEPEGEQDSSIKTQGLRSEGECLGCDGRQDSSCKTQGLRSEGECLGCDGMRGAVVQEPTGDVPLRKTHRLLLRGNASEVDVHKQGDQYYGLDGTWSIGVQDRQITRVVLRYAPLLDHASMDGDQLTLAHEPMEQYRRIKPLYKDALLVLRDHQGYLMLYRDAQRAAAILEVEYNGTGAFRIARSMLETVLDQLVKAGHRVAVVMDPQVDDPRMARQVDMWDALATEATLVDEPAVNYGAVELPMDKTEVRLCMVEQPYGTQVEVRWNWMGWSSREHRTVHLELRGGRASSETGYRSHFVQVSAAAPMTVDALLDLATEFCEERFAELNPGVDGNQQLLF